jgi:hypothetical protein
MTEKTHEEKMKELKDPKFRAEESVEPDEIDDAAVAAAVQAVHQRRNQLATKNG